MDRTELLTDIKLLTGSTNEDLLLIYLDMAAAVVLNTRDPFGVAELTEVEDKYLPDQLQIAVYLFNKRGAEGQTVHNENGVNRSYESGGVPRSLLKNIIPIGKPFGGG